MGCEVANIGLQIHGGMGFIEETGAAQLVRDARIAPIYEGTNGIQAIDLVTRKIPTGSLDPLMVEFRAIVDELRQSNRAQFAGLADGLSQALDDLQSATDHLLDQMQNGSKTAALAGASPYLRLFGLASGGAYLCQSALHCDAAQTDERAGLAQFMIQNCLVQTGSLLATVSGGAESLALAGAQFIQR